jgi:hypothetical protein
MRRCVNQHFRGTDAAATTSLCDIALFKQNMRVLANQIAVALGQLMNPRDEQSG